MDDKVVAFYKSKDFLMLGQAIGHKNWQSAMMCLTRLQNRAKEAEITEFDLNFKGIRQCIIAKDVYQAQNILALVVAKRVQFLNKMNN